MYSVLGSTIKNRSCWESDAKSGMDRVLIPVVRRDGFVNLFNSSVLDGVTGESPVISPATMRRRIDREEELLLLAPKVGHAAFDLLPFAIRLSQLEESVGSFVTVRGVMKGR